MALTKETLNRTKDEIVKSGYEVVTDCYVSWDENHENRRLFLSDGTNLGSHYALQYYSKENKCLLYVYMLNNNKDRRVFIPEKTVYGFEGVDIAIELNKNYLNSFDYHYVKNYCYKRFTGGAKKANLIDLIYQKHDYASISTGKNRLERELVVMDIDVNIEENKDKFDLLLNKFKSNNVLPTFICKNNDSKKHAQLIWALDEPIQYKEKYTAREFEKLQEILSLYESGLRDNMIKDFSIILSSWTPQGKKYKDIAIYLNNINCDISEMKADTEYTGWRCKNPFAGYKATEWFDHSVQYLMKGEYHVMDDNAIKKFRKKSYRNNLTKYNFDNLYNSILDKKVTEIETIQDKKDISAIIEEGTNKNFDDSDWEKRTVETDVNKMCRNNYVFMTTLIVAGQMLNSNQNLKNNKNEFFRLVESKVRYMYKMQNAQFKGIWNGTKTQGDFTESEFQYNFIHACEYVYKNHVFVGDINDIKGKYTDEQRNYAKVTKNWHKWLKLAYIKYAKEKMRLKSRKDIAHYINKAFLTNISVGYISNNYTANILKMSDTEFYLKFNNVRNEFLANTTNKNNIENYYKIDGWCFTENGEPQRKANWTARAEKTVSKCISWIDKKIADAEKCVTCDYSQKINDAYTEDEKKALYEQYIYKLLCLQETQSYYEVGFSPPE